MCRGKHGTRLVSRRETTASRCFSTVGSFLSRPTEGFPALPAKLACGPRPTAWPCSKASKLRPSISWKIKTTEGEINMRYQLAPLYCRPWTLNGISARLIESHYENNYGGALNRLNAISEEIEQLDLGATSGPALARLKRDEMVALNSTLLHELYFASLGGDGRVLPDA